MRDTVNIYEPEGQYAAPGESIIAIGEMANENRAGHSERSEVKAIGKVVDREPSERLEIQPERDGIYILHGRF